ncbi:GroES-like protein [Aspergillus californicus]
MATHPAVITPALGSPLTLTQVPTPPVEQNEVRVRVEWVPSSPLDVYQVDAGLMAQFPQSLGDTAAGTVVAVGPSATHLAIGDRVFGFFFHSEKERAQQVYATAPEHLFGKVPANISLEEAATVPNNFCTAYFALSQELGLELPWPRPENLVAKRQDTPVLIWGASTSVGQYAVQILKYWGYSNVIATSSPRHHERIRRYGAQHVFDYQDPAVVESIKDLLEATAAILVLDCVDSKSGSLLPISKIATQPGSVVAALLPVVVTPASLEKPSPLQIAADVSKEAEWAAGVEVINVVTYTYEANTFLRDHLQQGIMAGLLAEGAIEPNRFRQVEGATLLERAQKGLDLMRSGTVSGERIIWRVWTAEEFPDLE